MQNALLANLNKLHTTALGAGRIKRNLSLGEVDVIAWCRQMIETADDIVRRGKNWYIYMAAARSSPSTRAVIRLSQLIKSNEVHAHVQVQARL